MADHDSPPVSPALPQPPPAPIVDKTPEHLSLLARGDVAAGVEAVRVLGLLLANPHEPDRMARGQQLVQAARLAADITRSVAEHEPSAMSNIEAESAASLASLAENLLSMF